MRGIGGQIETVGSLRERLLVAAFVLAVWDPKRGVFEQRRQSFLPIDERHRRHIGAVKVQEIEGKLGQWALSRRTRLAGALNAG
jgi:hypothetical protein